MPTKPLTWNARGCVIAIVCLIASFPTTQTPRAQPNRDAALSGAARDFLDIWLSRRDVPTATAKYLSPLLTDERFIPPSVSPPEEARLRQTREWARSEHVTDFKTTQNRMQEYLMLVGMAIPQQPLKELLMPFSLADARSLDANLGRILTALEPRPLPDLPALVYRVRQPKDIAWTATGTVGYDTTLPSLRDKEDLDVQAIVSRIRVEEAGSDPFLVVMVWAERKKFPGDWKLLGVEVPPTN